MTNAKRYLIVNADDFGQSPGVNRGVITAHEEGIVTSASLMVRSSAVDEAVRYSLEHTSLSLGMHFDICEWIFKNGEWVNLYQVVPTSDAEAVAAELQRQLTIFRNLMGRNPTHLDTHQHIHHKEPVRSVLIEAARALKVPLREMSPAVRYCGKFYGQSVKGESFPEFISVEGMKKTVSTLQEGITEIACHPATIIDFETTYAQEREVELKTLCDPEVRETIEREGIALCSFQDVANLDMAGLVP